MTSILLSTDELLSICTAFFEHHMEELLAATNTSKLFATPTDGTNCFWLGKQMSLLAAKFSYILLLLLPN